MYYIKIFFTIILRLSLKCEREMALWAIGAEAKLWDEPVVGIMKFKGME